MAWKEQPKINSKDTSKDLSGKRVVIMGGSSGIGFAIAEQVVALSGEAVIVSSNADRVRKAVADLDSNAQGHAIDLTDYAAIQTFFENLGSLDHLVFTAGDSLHLDMLANVDLQEARNAFELRYWSALAAVKYATAKIRAGGSIVLTSGIAGERPQKGWALGASVCGAMDSLTKALAVELAPIRVNAVSPGVVKTHLWNSLPTEERERMFDSVGKSLLVGRVGEADEIAKAYLFLMQESFCTGQIVVVDGGALLV